MEEDSKMEISKSEGEVEYNDGDYAEEGEEEDELYDDDDDYANQEAEEMAKHLGDALWADISKAFAVTTTTTQQRSSAAGVHSEGCVDEEILVDAVQEVIDLTEVHSELLQKLSETPVPNSEDNLYDALNDIVHNRHVPVEQANVLADLVQSIVHSDFFQ